MNHYMKATGQTRVYVSGPMTGIPEFNFPLFDEARDYLRASGHLVCSPADMDRGRDDEIETRPGFATGTVVGDDGVGGYSYQDMLAEDFEAIIDGDVICMLPGWESSTGANHELYVARALGKDVWYYVPEEHYGYRIKGVDPKRQASPPAPVIIGLCGYAQVGKDTVGRILVEQHGFTRISFADALRDMLYALNPVIFTPGSVPGDHTLSRLTFLVDTYGWDRAKVNYPEIRELLQRLGTEAGRGVLGDSIWVDTAMTKVQAMERYKGGSAPERFVFTDVRFPNEVDAIRNAGGLMVRITRPGTEPVNGHASETALDGYDLGEDSLTISNSGTMDSLTFATSLLVNGKLSD